MENKYLKALNKGMFNEQNEISLLYKIANSQASNMLYNYLVNKYKDLDPTLICQLIIDIYTGSKLFIDNNEELTQIIIFVKVIINNIFKDNIINEFVIIEIPHNIDVNFIRSLLFDYGLRMRIIDNKLIITWKKIYNDSNGYPFDQLLSKDNEEAKKQLK